MLAAGSALFQGIQATTLRFSLFTSIFPFSSSSRLKFFNLTFLFSLARVFPRVQLPLAFPPRLCYKPGILEFPFRHNSSFRLARVSRALIRVTRYEKARFASWLVERGAVVSGWRGLLELLYTSLAIEQIICYGNDRRQGCQIPNRHPKNTTKGKDVSMVLSY